MNKGRLLVLLLIAALIAAFFAFDLHRHLTLDTFRSQQAAIDTYVRAHPLTSAAVYFAIYVLVTGLSLPGAAVSPMTKSTAANARARRMASSW